MKLWLVRSMNLVSGLVAFTVVGKNLKHYKGCSLCWTVECFLLSHSGPLQRSMKLAVKAKRDCAQCLVRKAGLCRLERENG